MDNMIMSPVNIEVRKGRKRRPSNSLEDDTVMDDCTAALVLMSLSCSPKSTFIPDRGTYSMSVKSIDSGVGYCSAASRSNTPSPTTINEDTTAPIAIEISKNNEQINGLTINKDEGIDMDETIDFIIDEPIQTSVEKARRIVFKCTWRGCGLRCDLVEDIEKHVRIVHLGRSEATVEDDNDHEEEFYYAEIEEEMEIDNISSKESSCSSDSSLGPLSPVSSSPESPNSTNYNLSPTLSSASLLFFAPSPTWSHLDMARPPHEDPEYQKQQKQLQQQQQQQLQQNQQVQNVNQTILSAQIKPEPERKTVISSPINIPGISVAHRWSTKGRDSASSSFSTSCNSSYSFSNSHHHHHHLNNHMLHHHTSHANNNNNNYNNNNNHHYNQSQASLLASSPSPVNLFSPKAPSKVMRLSSNTSSPVNIKSTNSTTSVIAVTSLASSINATGTVNLATNSVNTSNNISTTNSNNSNSSNNTTSITLNSTNASNSSNHSSNSNQWTSLLQSSSSSTNSKGHSISPTRRTRTETRKCRKVYGMENRDSWCTQCKWKKACTRFVD